MAAAPPHSFCQQKGAALPLTDSWMKRKESTFNYTVAEGTPALEVRTSPVKSSQDEGTWGQHSLFAESCTLRRI